MFVIVIIIAILVVMGNRDNPPRQPVPQPQPDTIVESPLPQPVLPTAVLTAEPIDVASESPPEPAQAQHVPAIEVPLAQAFDRREPEPEPVTHAEPLPMLDPEAIIEPAEPLIPLTMSRIPPVLLRNYKGTGMTVLVRVERDGSASVIAVNSERPIPQMLERIVRQEIERVAWRPARRRDGQVAVSVRLVNVML